ncbi:hypothetical protein RJ641_013050 [Dillenia turbinata]|uniref:Amine oxidase domain-containing protein n=1 Tax=Dillenia turbinata TaxID=194707 RepID=A0AAN8WCN5_9MAGN
MDKRSGKLEADVVIGRGIGGLCCAELLARYKEDVLPLESHHRPGGAAHTFDIKGYKFDWGPSLFSGFQARGGESSTQLLNLSILLVLDAQYESGPCANYDSWMAYIPEGEFLSRIGPTEFLELDHEKYASPNAMCEWQKLLVSVNWMQYFQCLLLQCPCLLSMQGDFGLISTAAARYASSLLKSCPNGATGGPWGYKATKAVLRNSTLSGAKRPIYSQLGGSSNFPAAGLKYNGILSAEMATIMI